MRFRRLRWSPLVLLLVLVVQGCGGGAVTPPGGGIGSVAGTVTVSVASAGAVPLGADLRVLRGVSRRPPNAPLFAPDELLVKFRPGTLPEQAGIHAQFGAREVSRVDRIGVSVLRITSGEPVQAVVNRYRAHPLVEYAEPNFYRYLDATPQAAPNDPLYGLQWHYGNVNLEAAWDITTGSSLVVVAVIDTGILSHIDLSDVTVQGWDFFSDDPNPADPGCPTPSDLSHGTHVAGTIAARTNNGVGVAGVNWGGPGRTRIMPLRIFGNIGGVCTTTTARIVAAIQYAADHSARVINMSFGGPGFSQAEQDAVNYAFNTGVILVAAAGNENSNLTTNPRYPVCYDNVVGVAATDAVNVKTYYSNFGNCVDLAAPGGDLREGVDENGDGNPDGVLSTSGTAASPSQYWWFSGTSMAAPHVAGLAALLLSNGVTGPATIQGVMQNTAVDLGTPGDDPIYGWGLIDAGAALGAPAATNPMRAFTGSLSDSVITVASDIVTVASNGAFVITNAQSGTWTVFAWQDANGNGVIDAGDMYGQTPGVNIFPGSTTTGVLVQVSEVPIGTPPRTLAGGP